MEGIFCLHEAELDVRLLAQFVEGQLELVVGVAEVELVKRALWDEG